MTSPSPVPVTSITPVELWTHTPEMPPTHFAIAARAGDVVLADAEGHLWALDSTDGHVRWKSTVIAPAHGIAIASGGERVYALGGRGHFVVLDGEGVLVHQERLDASIRMMDLAPGASTILLSDGATATWERDPRSHRMQRLPLASRVSSVREIPGRNALVALLPSGTAAVMGKDGGIPDRIRGDHSLTEVAVAAHGNLLAFAAGSSGVLIADGAGTVTALFRLDNGAAVAHVECDAAGERFALADHQGRVLYLDQEGQVLWHRAADAGGALMGLRLSGDAKRLIVVTADGAVHAYMLDSAGVASATRSNGVAPPPSPSGPRRAGATHSNASVGARHGSGAEAKAPLWTIPAFAGERTTYLGAAAISPDAGLLGFLDRERREVRLLDVRGSTLASVRVTGTNLTIDFVDSQQLIVTGSEGVLAVTARSRDGTMSKTSPVDLTGIALAAGVPFALGWDSLGAVYAQAWDGAVRWTGKAGKTRITHGALSATRAWIVNAAGAVAELDLEGKVLSKTELGPESVSAAVAWGTMLVVAAGHQITVVGPGGRAAWKSKVANPVAALYPRGDHLLVRDLLDRVTVYNLAGIAEAKIGPWPGRWAVTESTELGGIVVLVAETETLTCHRPAQGVAWRVRMEEPIVDVEASADGRFAVVLEGPRMSLWALGSAELPESAAQYLEL